MLVIHTPYEAFSNMKFLSKPDGTQPFESVSKTSWRRVKTMEIDLKITYFNPPLSRASKALLNTKLIYKPTRNIFTANSTCYTMTILQLTLNLYGTIVSLCKFFNTYIHNW